MRKFWYKNHIIRSHPVGLAICRREIDKTQTILKVVDTYQQAFSWIDAKTQKPA